MNYKLAILTLLIVTIAAAARAQVNSSTKLSPDGEVIFRNLDSNVVPLFAFTYISPWRHVYGSDSPEFVLYEDGSLIFRKCPEKDNPYDCRFQIVTLSTDEISRIMEKLVPQEFYSLNDRYIPDSSKVIVTDLASRVFVMRKPDGTYKKVSTYGALSGNEEGYVAVGVPKALKDLADFAISYENKNSRQLQFEYVEMIIEPYGDDADLKKSVRWPQQLPDLSDARTIKHPAKDLYSIFIKGSVKIPDAILKLRKYRSKNIEAALVIGQRKWTEELRFPFPFEEYWLGDFRNR